MATLPVKVTRKPQPERAEVERRRKAEAEAAGMLVISRTMAARVAELERELETQRAIEEIEVEP